MSASDVQCCRCKAPVSKEDMAAGSMASLRLPVSKIVRTSDDGEGFEGAVAKEKITWCLLCGPPWRHAEGCDCAGCVLWKKTELPPVATTMFDLATAFFGKGDAASAAMTRLTMDLGATATAIAADPNAPHPAPGRGEMFTVGAALATALQRAPSAALKKMSRRERRLRKGRR